MSNVNVKMSTTALDTLQGLVIDELRRIVVADCGAEDWSRLHRRYQQIITTADYIFDPLVVESLRRSFTLLPAQGVPSGSPGGVASEPLGGTGDA